MNQRSWLPRGFLLILILLTIAHSTAPADGYWVSQDFTTSQGSLIRIGTEVGSLEWTTGKTYEIGVIIIVRAFGPNIDRFYDIWIECKWESSIEETKKSPQGPHELVRRYQKTNETFTYFPIIGGDQILYFRVNITEAITDGSDAPWSSDWQKTFDLRVTSSEASERDLKLWLIPMFLVSFAFLGISGLKRE